MERPELTAVLEHRKKFLPVVNEYIESRENGDRNVIQARHGGIEKHLGTAHERERDSGMQEVPGHDRHSFAVPKKCGNGEACTRGRKHIMRKLKKTGERAPEKRNRVCGDCSQHSFCHALYRVD